MSQGKNKAADLTTFGGRLRYARELRGIKNTDLAKAAGIRQAKISQWERNRWSANRAAAPKLAKALNVSLEWLVLGCGETPKEAQAREAAYDLHQDEIDSLLDLEDETAGDAQISTAKRLREIRKALSMSMAKVARAMGYSHASGWQRWESDWRYAKDPHIPLRIAEKVWDLVLKSGKPAATRSEIMALAGVSALEGLMNTPAPWEQVSRKDIRAVADQLQELVVRLRILCAE